MLSQVVMSIIKYCVKTAVPHHSGDKAHQRRTVPIVSPAFVVSLAVFLFSQVLPRQLFLCTAV